MTNIPIEIVIFAAMMATFLVDPIGWVLIGIAACLALNRLAWWIVPIVTIVATAINMMLVNPKRASLGLGPIPPDRLLVQFLALTAISFAAYFIVALIMTRWRRASTQA